MNTIDPIYEKFKKRWEEVVEIPPQQVGFLTPLYKRVTKPMKTMPFPILFILSALVVGTLYVVFGSRIAWLVSLLQRGI